MSITLLVLQLCASFIIVVCSDNADMVNNGLLKPISSLLERAEECCLALFFGMSSNFARVWSIIFCVRFNIIYCLGCHEGGGGL